MLKPRFERRANHALHNLLHGQRLATRLRFGFRQQSQPLRVGGAEAAQESLNVERFLRAEVISGRAQVDPGLIRKHPHSNPVVTMFPEEPLRRVQQASNRLLVVRRVDG